MEPLILTLSGIVFVSGAWLKIWSRYRLWGLYPKNDYLRDAQGRRLFWIGKITPLFFVLGVLGAAWCTHIWWVFAWACVFYAGVVLLVVLATRYQLRILRNAG